MSTTAITISDQRQPAEQREPKRIRLGRKLKHVIDLIVYEGMEMDEAARTANTSTRAIRRAFEKRHVIAHLRATREVFRASVSAQNIHHAVKMRNAAGNAMAQLGAMKFIEQIEDAQVSAPGRAQAPGVVIQIVNAPPAPTVTPSQRSIDANPLIDQASVSDV